MTRPKFEMVSEAYEEKNSKIRPTVFISYNWGSDAIADELEAALLPYATVLRDKSSLQPWGDLRSFMNSIRDQDYVVLIISDKYLHSTACLYEVLQLMKDDGWDKRAMYLVTDDAHRLYDVVEQVNYINCWVEKAQELRDKLALADLAATAEQAKELKKLEMIKLNIGDFMSRVRDRSNPSVQDGIKAIVNLVSKETGKEVQPDSIEIQPTIVAQLRTYLADGQVEEFVDLYISQLKRFHRLRYESWQQYYDDFNDMCEPRNQFLDSLDAYRQADILPEVMERLYNELYCEHTFEPGRNQCSLDEFDIFRLHLWELFVLTTAFLLVKNRFKDLHTLLVHTYFLRSSPLTDEIEANNYTAFNFMSKYMERIIKENVKPEGGGSYYTLAGHLLCNHREYGKTFTKRTIAEADLFLFQVYGGLKLSSLKGDPYWFPRCYVYAGNSGALWTKMSSRKYCESILPLFGVQRIDELRDVIRQCHYGQDIGYMYGLADPAPEIKEYIDISAIGTKP